MTVRERNSLAATVAAFEDSPPLAADPIQRIEILRAANGTGRTIERGGILGLGAIDDPVCSATVAEWRFKELNVAVGETPLLPDHLTRWGIVLEDVRDTHCVPVLVHGEAFVRVIVRDVNHACIQPRHNDPTFAVTCPNSSAHIQWIEDSRGQSPYDWRWAKVVIDQSTPIVLTAQLHQALQAPQVQAASVTSFQATVATGELDRVTATGRFTTGAWNWTSSGGVLVQLSGAGPERNSTNETLTVRLYRVSDDVALIDPPAYRDGTFTLSTFAKQLTPTTATARIVERRGSAWVRTPHLLTIESVDDDLALDADTFVEVTPSGSNRWKILSSACAASALDQSAKLL